MCFSRFQFNFFSSQIHLKFLYKNLLQIHLINLQLLAHLIDLFGNPAVPLPRADHPPGASIRQLGALLVQELLQLDHVAGDLRAGHHRTAVHVGWKTEINEGGAFVWRTPSTWSYRIDPFAPDSRQRAPLSPAPRSSLILPSFCSTPQRLNPISRRTPLY